MTEFFTVSYDPKRFPELDLWLKSLPKMKRSENVCAKLTEAITDDRIDKLIALVERIALGTPMQSVIEQVKNGDLPGDVIGNLLELGE